MLKHIFKNLWNRRVSNAWIFVELIIVTILTWVILDPAVITFANNSIDTGYDIDRLAIIQIDSYPRESRHYNPADTARYDDFMKTVEKVRAMPEVEHATYMRQILNDMGISSNAYNFEDSTDVNSNECTMAVRIFPNSDFFETYGITLKPGSPSLDSVTLTDNGQEQYAQIYITEEYYNARFPGKQLKDLKFERTFDWDGQLYKYIFDFVGITSNVMYTTYFPTYCTAFEIENPKNIGRYGTMKIVARLHEGESVSDFIDKVVNKRKELATGNYYISDVRDYKEQIAAMNSDRGVDRTRNLATILAVFFLVNLILGIIGTFTLQTRRRIAEMGVRRSFGARARHIVMMLLSESWILTTIAFIIGDAIYLQYALSNGLVVNDVMSNVRLTDTWQNSFWPHFAGMSLIVYLIIMVCVTIGTAYPAFKAVRVNPVDALRDE